MIFFPGSTQSFREFWGKEGVRCFECHKIRGVSTAFSAQGPGMLKVLNVGVSPTKWRTALSTILFMSPLKSRQVIPSASHTSATDSWNPTLYFQPWLLSLKTQTNWSTSPSPHSTGQEWCVNPNKMHYLWSPPPPPKKIKKTRKSCFNSWIVPQGTISSSILLLRLGRNLSFANSHEMCYQNSWLVTASLSSQFPLVLSRKW